MSMRLQGALNKIKQLGNLNKSLAKEIGQLKAYIEEISKEKVLLSKRVAKEEGHFQGKGK